MTSDPSPNRDALDPGRWDIFRQSENGLRAMLRHRLSDPGDIDDCVQAVLVKWIERGNNVPPAASRAWLFRVAANEAARLWRRREAADRDGSPPVTGNPVDRCVRYLIGEMGPEETECFKQDLEHSADLADELIRSSNLVLGLATVSERRPQPSPDSPSSSTRSTPARSTPAWWWPATVAVAASLLFVLLIWRPQLLPLRSADEELRIAQAWVTLDVAESNSTEPELPPPLPPQDENDVTDSSLPRHSDSLLSDDATFDPDDGLPEWLVAAVSAELDRDQSPTQQAEGDRNDG